MTSPETSTPLPRPLLYTLVSGLLAALAIVVLLQMRLLPTGVPGQWQWPWRDSQFVCQPHLILICGVLGLLLAGLLHTLRRPVLQRRHICAFVAAACLAVATTLLLLEADESLPPLHLSAATASVPATGYFAYATALEGVRPLMQALSGVQGVAPPLPARVATHPPGPVLFYYFGIKTLNLVPELSYAVEQCLVGHYGLTTNLMYAYTRGYLMGTVTPQHLIQALILGLLLTLLGSLLPLAGFLCASALGSARHGLLAAFLAALLPSLLLFIPSIDGLGAVLALSTVAAWLWALKRRSTGLFVLTGLLMFAAMFWSLGLGAVAICMLVCAIPFLLDPETRRCTLQGLLQALSTFIVLHVLLYTFEGYSLIGNVRLMMASQRLEMQANNRDYLTWLGMNLWDLPLFMGPLLLSLTLVSLVQARQTTREARYYTMGSIAALGLVWLSGSTLGEVGRIWLFLMALLVPVAALPLVELAGKPRTRALALVALGQGLLVIVMHCSLWVVHA